jgi:hypothetical protein
MFNIEVRSENPPVVEITLYPEGKPTTWKYDGPMGKFLLDLIKSGHPITLTEVNKRGEHLLANLQETLP